MCRVSDELAHVLLTVYQNRKAWFAHSALPAPTAALLARHELEVRALVAVSGCSRPAAVNEVPDGCCP